MGRYLESRSHLHNAMGSHHFALNVHFGPNYTSAKSHVCISSGYRHSFVRVGSLNRDTGTRRPAKTGKPGSMRYTRSTSTSRLRRPSTGRTVFHATATIHLSCGSRCRSFLDVKTAMSRCSLHLTPLTRFWSTLETKCWAFNPAHALLLLHMHL